MNRPAQVTRVAAWITVCLVGMLIAATVLNTRAWGQGAKTPGEPESSPAALTAYTDAVNFQNKMAFELAADEWDRFLKRFADDPLAAKAMHYRGVCLVQLKRYDEAVNTLLGLVAKYPRFELLEEAYLNLAWSQYRLGVAGDPNRYAQAVETFDKLEKAYPKGAKIDQALFFKAEALYALDKKKEAALTYGKLVTQHEQSEYRADALYALGVTLEDLEQWEQAAKSYNMFLERYAKDELASEVRMRLAESIMQGGDAKKAAALFAEVAALPDFAAADFALMRQAYCVERQGQDLEAAKLYGELVERFPKSSYAAECALLAARSYYRANQMKEAAQWFDRCLTLPGAALVEAAHWRSRIHLQDQQPQEALALAEKVLAEAPEDPFVPELRLDKADALNALPDRKAQAVKEYASIAESCAEHRVGPVALYDAAFAALELRDFSQAAQLAGQFLAKYPQHALTPDVRYVVAECRIQTKAYAEAEAIYRQILSATKDHPELPVWRARLALVLHLQQKYQEAIDLLTPQLDQTPGAAERAELLHLVGINKFQLQDYAGAAETLSQAMASDAHWRQADETLLYLARAQRQLNQLPAAVGSLESLLKNYPHSTLLDQAYYHLGESHYAGDQFPQALAAYGQVISQHAQSAYVPLALYGQGWAQLKSGQFAPAVTSFTTLLEKYPDHALKNEAMLARAMSLRQAQRYAEAIADIDNYLTTNPEPAQQANALYERGLAEAADGKQQQAVSTFNQLLESHPKYEHADKVLYELAWACRALPDNESATKAFARLAREHATSPLAAEAQFHVGEGAYAAQDYAAAAAAYEAAAQTATAALKTKVLYKLGWSDYQLQKYDAALAQFEALLQADAEGELASDAWFMKGECLLRNKKYEQALAAYQQAVQREPSSPSIAVLRLLHAGQAAGQLGKWKESIQLLDKIIAEHTESGFLAEAYFERAQAKRGLEQLDEAIQDYRAAADQSRGVVGLRGLVMIGEIEFQLKRFDEAIKDFQRAMFRAVPTDASPDLLGWQAKAGFEAGRCAEAQIAGAKSAAARSKHIDDAKKFYQYVVQTHEKHELAQSAQKRLEELARLGP